MILVVTNLPEDYGEDILTCSTIKESLEKKEVADRIIYNRAIDENEASVSEIRELFTGMHEIIFVRNVNTMNYDIKLFVEGLGGKVFTEETYMTSRATLDMLFDDSIITTEVATLDNTGTISEFSQKLNDGSDITRAYGDLVVACTEQVVERNKVLEESERQIALSSVKMIGQLLDRVEDVKKEQKGIKGILEKKNEQIQDVMEGATITDGVYLYDDTGAGEPYSEVQYRNRNINVMLVKDVDRCKYLLSFIGGLQRYISSVMKIKCRVLVVENAGVLAQEKYQGNFHDDYAWINAENVERMDKLSNKSVIFTDCIRTRVFKKLLEDTNFEITVILDRTNYSKKHILATAYPKAIYYAVQSNSSKKVVKAERDKCITSDKSVDAKYMIDYDEEYPTLNLTVDKLQRYVYKYKTLYQDMVQSCESLRTFYKGGD